MISFNIQLALQPTATLTLYVFFKSDISYLIGLVFDFTIFRVFSILESLPGKKMTKRLVHAAYFSNCANMTKLNHELTGGL